MQSRRSSRLQSNWNLMAWSMHQEMSYVSHPAVAYSRTKYSSASSQSTKFPQETDDLPDHPVGWLYSRNPRNPQYSCGSPAPLAPGADVTLSLHFRMF